jgi:hypothetical protein
MHNARITTHLHRPPAGIVTANGVDVEAAAAVHHAVEIADAVKRAQKVVQEPLASQSAVMIGAARPCQTTRKTQNASRAERCVRA